MRDAFVVVNYKSREKEKEINDDENFTERHIYGADLGFKRSISRIDQYRHSQRARGSLVCLSLNLRWQLAPCRLLVVNTHCLYSCFCLFANSAGIVLSCLDTVTYSLYMLDS